MRKTIITSSQKTQDLRQYYLKKENVLTGIHILPFKASFYENDLNLHAQFLKDYETIQNLPLKLLKELIKFPKILDEFLSFKFILDGYGITPDFLPTDNEYDIEIQTIFTALHKPMKTPSSDMVYLEDGLKHHELNYLETHQIEKLKLNNQTKPQSVKYKNALNFRQELEGAIQYILDNHLEDVGLIIPNKIQNEAFVLSVLKRYGYESDQDFSFDLIKKQYLALLNYIEKPTQDHVLQILQANALNLRETENLLFYIEHFQMTHNAIFEPFNLAPDSDVPITRDILSIQEKIQDDVLALQEVLNTLNNLPLDDKLIYALEIIQNNNPIKSAKIRQYLQNAILYITSDNLHVVKYQIDALSDESIKHPTLKLYDLNNLPLEPHKHLIALGLSAKTLPGIKGRSGILDEAYCARIQGFPSQTVRNNAALKEKYRLFEKSENLILSYHTINFEGKAQEPSFPVENFVRTYDIQKPTAWHILEANPFMDETSQLTKDIAEKLYLKDGYLEASVSSLEKYMNRPYDYFLEDGLKLSRPFDFGFDGRILGTFSHEYIEKMLQDNTTDYQSLWSNYAPYFSTHNALIPLLLNFHQETLNEHVQSIQEKLAGSAFKSYQQEKYILNKDLFKGISMRGFIDRIDLAHLDNQEAFMIIDYKSSDHTLSPASVQKGLQLQLLTYALVLRQKLDASLFGVYYYALNRKRSKRLENSYLQSRGITLQDKSQIEAKYKEQFVYTGWTFQDLESYGLDPEGFKSSRPAKQFKNDTGFDIDIIEDFMKLMLHKIKRNILNGIIDLDALEHDFQTRPLINTDGIWSETHE